MEWVDAPVINAGDGTHEHPTQALLDAYTMRSGSATSTARTSPSSATCSTAGWSAPTIYCLRTLGARRHARRPADADAAGHRALGRDRRLRYDRTTSTRSLPTADAVMMLRVQRERMSGGFFPTAREYTVGYGLTRERLARSMRPSMPSSATPAR